MGINFLLQEKSFMQDELVALRGGGLPGAGSGSELRLPLTHRSGTGSVFRDQHGRLNGPLGPVGVVAVPELGSVGSQTPHSMPGTRTVAQSNTGNQGSAEETLDIGREHTTVFGSEN